MAHKADLHVAQLVPGATVEVGRGREQAQALRVDGEAHRFQWQVHDAGSLIEQKAVCRVELGRAGGAARIGHMVHVGKGRRAAGLDLAKLLAQDLVIGGLYIDRDTGGNGDDRHQSQQRAQGQTRVASQPLCGQPEQSPQRRPSHQHPLSCVGRDDG